MYKPRLVQQTKCIQKLLSKYSNQGRTQSPKLILLDELVQVDAKKLKDQAKVLLVDKCVFQPQDVVIIIFVEFTVELQKTFERMNLAFER